LQNASVIIDAFNIALAPQKSDVAVWTDEHCFFEHLGKIPLHPPRQSFFSFTLKNPSSLKRDGLMNYAHAMKNVHF
jgi:hypothetical protein